MNSGSFDVGDLSSLGSCYQPPKQERARVTEQRFLECYEMLLGEKGFAGVSVDDIAAMSGLGRAAFLKRFGSKETALLLLYRRYCHDASAEMARLRDALPDYTGLRSVLYAVSEAYCALLSEHRAVNRAMGEFFYTQLRVHPMTQAIFRDAVAMMEAIQQRWLEQGTYTVQGAWSGAQLLVHLHFGNLLGATSGLPQEDRALHALVVDVVEVGLRR